MLAPQVKKNSEHPQSYKLKMRMCVNSNINSKEKSIKKHSPTCLGDSLRFTIAVSAFFSLWLSVADVVNCFQNTMRDLNDETHMRLPP